MEYTKEYFIKKFAAIPDEEIGEISINEHCALWHCGVNITYDMTEESIALIRLFNGRYEHDTVAVTDVNDGIGAYQLLGSTPKERILNRLKQLP